tara:strand:- start:17722 stop:18021 length:300 start_codon:yes stop_codon:yes gene_type:complete
MGLIPHQSRVDPKIPVINLQGVRHPIPATLKTGNQVVVVTPAGIRWVEIDKDVDATASSDHITKAFNVPAVHLYGIECPDLGRPSVSADHFAPASPVSS